MKVELLNVFGDDNMIVDAARVSFGKESHNYSAEDNQKLIRFLLKHNHWSPFSHPQLQYRIECPIYVERQIVKTEAGRVYNSISGRYVDFSDSYTRIKEWRKQSTNNKQGSEGLINEQHTAADIESDLIAHAQNAYSNLLRLGVSKEQARSVLPLSLNTIMIWTGSLWTFLRLYKQRIKKDAQQETGFVVKLMMEELKKTNKFESTLKIMEESWLLS